MFALDASQLQNYATFGAVVPILIGLFIFKLVANALVRTFVLAIALAVGALVFLQRNEISACVDDARANLELDQARVTCTVLGFDVDLDI